MASEHTLEQLLINPTPAAAWTLRGDLLALGHAPSAPALAILADYHHFLSHLEQVTSAVEYTQLAYWLSAGAALLSFAGDSVNLLNPLWMLSNLLPKGLDEGLDVLAAGNYVKSAETALQSLQQTSAWRLYDHLWQQGQPDLPPEARRQIVDQLFDPFFAETRPLARTIIIGRLFQYALLTELTLSRAETAAP